MLSFHLHSFLYLPRYYYGVKGKKKKEKKKKKKNAETRIRTWVIAATTQCPNH